MADRLDGEASPDYVLHPEPNHENDLLFQYRVRRDADSPDLLEAFLHCRRTGSVLNGANLRVVWDDFCCGFLVAGAMADFDHLMPRNIQ